MAFFMRLSIGLLVALLVALPATLSETVAAEVSTSDLSTICNNKKARKAAKLWGYNPVDAYQFGLKIQHYVESEDLKLLFNLVEGELARGPRKKFIQGKSFKDLYSDKWREVVLSNKPECTPVGWRGFMMGHGKIWYQQSNETNEWKIFVIQGAKIQEGAKATRNGRWEYKGNPLTIDCFTTQWVSGDNYQYHHDKFGKSNGVDYGDFIANPGRYIGGPLPIDPNIVSPWPKSTTADELRLTKRLTQCLKYGATTNLEFDGGWVSESRCHLTDGYCRKHSYRVLKRISLDHCWQLVRYFPQNCVELALVETSVESGGSIGNYNDVGIYGVVVDPATQKLYVMPLVNLGSVNKALNYTDQLDQCPPNDREVSLLGELSLETYAGRPNYESVEQGDEAETGYYLLLQNSICVEGTNHETGKSSPIFGIKKLQLSINSPQLRSEVNKLYRGRHRVIVTGTTHLGATGHYHAPHNAALGVEKINAATK